VASTGLAGEGAHEFVACTALIRNKSKNAIIRACLEQRAIRANILLFMMKKHAFKQSQMAVCNDSLQ
jgi:hypothetical protein